jgi:site-specific DNA-methyltransferase (adenine-specific)
MADIVTAKYTLHCGDCLPFMQAMEAGCIDLTVTSPPYYNARPEYSEWKSYAEYLEFMNMAIKGIYHISKDSGRIAINIPDGYGRNPWIPLYADICKLVESIGFTLRGSIVWNKGNGAGKTSWGSWRSSSNPCLIDEHEMILVAHKTIPNIDSNEEIDKSYFLNMIHSIWNIKPETQVSGHPAPFPIKLPARLIKLLSSNQSVVFDPFFGSGTTGVACMQLGRRFVGCELNPGYFEIATRRIAQAAAQEPLFTI